MRKTIIHHETPVVIYNSDKQEIIGIFKTPTLCARYLYSNPSKSKNVNGSLRTKSRMHKTLFDFPVASRYANKDHIETLGELDYIILNEYPEVKLNEMKGFDSTKEFFYKENCERLHRYSLEMKNHNKKFI